VPPRTERRGETTTIEILERFRMRSAGDVTVLGPGPPVVLRRMSRRSTGSQVQAAREAAVQWIPLSL